MSESDEEGKEERKRLQSGLEYPTRPMDSREREREIDEDGEASRIQNLGSPDERVGRAKIIVRKKEEVLPILIE